MARPRNVRIAGQFVEAASTWTVATVRSALDSHERGMFRQSSRLSDAMGRDPRISGALDTRVRALSSRSALPFGVETSDEGDGRKREAVARRMRELWWSSCPESAVGPILRDAIMLGVSVGRITWTNGDEWVPTLEWLPPHGLSYEYDFSSEYRWIYNDKDGIRHHVTPGDGTWFLYLPGGPRSWMTGRVRSLGLPWFGGVCTERDWNRYNEKHGLAILSIDEPFWAQDDVEGEAGADGTHAEAYYEQFRNLGSESVLRNPQGQDKDTPGWAAKFLEPVGDTWASFEGHLKHLGQLIDATLLGKSGDSGPKGGDGELAHERVRVEYLATDAETLATTIRDQVWKPFALFNYDDQDAAGWGRWNTRPPPDLKMRAETLKSFGDALTALAPHGVDKSPLYDEFGLAKGEPEQLPVAAAPAEQAPAAP